MRPRHESERGAALIVAILVLAILTVIGIALMLITSTEARIAANEWSINRAFYSADAGIRWAAGQLLPDPRPFLERPEFGSKAAPVFQGTTLFRLPSHRFQQGFGFVGTDDIEVRVSTPGRLGRRKCMGCDSREPNGQFAWMLEVRSTGGQSDAFLQYSKALVADVDIGPLPSRLPY
jgi:hypothetical protein